VALTLTPAERRVRARVAAFAMHAQGGTNTAPAFAARMRRLEDQVDPERRLPPDERARRVRQALRSQMAALSLRSMRVKNKGAARDVEPRAARLEGHGHDTPAR